MGSIRTIDYPRVGRVQIEALPESPVRQTARHLVFQVKWGDHSARIEIQIADQDPAYSSPVDELTRVCLDYLEHHLGGWIDRGELADGQRRPIRFPRSCWDELNFS